MAQTKPKAAQFYGVSNNGTDGQFLKTDGTGGMSWDSPITNPTITSIDYPGTATAADPAGGESVIINGTLFASGVTCTVGGTSAVTAFNSATQITITTPAKAAGQYTVAVTNTDGGTVSQANFIQYSGVPVWSTASGSLGSVQDGATASFQVTATEGSDTIEYAVTTGSLPSGLSLNTNTGAITGTAPSVSASTTTTFSITATDDENQTSSARSFNITVTPDVPSNHFTPMLYTGNGYPNTGVSQTITTGFQPDFVITKGRDYTDYWGFQDSVRGAGYSILTGYSAGQQTSQNLTTISAFNSNGYSLGEDTSAIYNKNNQEYVSYAFKAGGTAVSNTDGSITSSVSVNNTLGFSIVKYDGSGASGSASTVGHGLDAAPQLVIVKCYEQGKTVSAIFVYAEGAGNTKEGYFYDNSAFGPDTGRWNSTSPTSTVFTLGSSWSSYPAYYAGDTIAYCFTSKPGFSKVGSYTGTGAEGNNILLDFEPAFVMIKCSSASGTNWVIVDNKRDNGDAWLYPNKPDAEFDDANLYTRFYANGFSVNGNASYVNTANATYIYLAFAADPSTTTPSLANSFDTTLWSNGVNQHQSPITGVGFKPDLTWIKMRNAGTSHVLTDVARGVTQTVFANDTDQQYTIAQGLTAFNIDGFSLGNDSRFNQDQRNAVSWNWKAGGTPSINTDGSVTSLVSANQAAGFSIVKYNGSYPSSGTVGHGLSQTPELFFMKTLSMVAQWLIIYNSGQTGGYFNGDPFAASRYNAWLNNASPTNTTIPLGAYNYVNGNMIMYCFHSITGYSKVGTYSGSGAANKQINTGFQPSFLMIKNITNTGSTGWAILDTARGGTTGNGNALFANSSGSEWTNNTIDIDFTATGFTIQNGYVVVNDSSDSYIYLAIKEN